jgi:regulatory protein
MRGRRNPDDEPERPTVNVRAAALALLARRDYTAKELRTKLARRGYDATEVDEAVAALAAEHWQDDARVAAAHTRAAAGAKGRGRYRIERELAARGIAKDLAKQAVGALTAADESAAIDAVLRRRRIGALSSPADRRRVFQHLMRRGFSSDAILRALRRHGIEDDGPADG